MNYNGVVAACGLAGGTDLPTTVMPFILLGVKLLGVDSVMLLSSKNRVKAWERIVVDLPAGMLEGITAQTVRLEQVGEAAEAMLAGKLRGRVLVDVN